RSDHPKLDVQVAGWAATRADLALAGQLDAGARVDARRDLDGQRPPRTDPAVARALTARPRVDRAVPVALRAWPGRHHLAEERPLHLADLALAATRDRKSTRLNSSHVKISYAVFCLKKK